MFCRYCGSHIPDDSLFCAKCGKRLGPREHPRLAKIVKTLHLKTPYPYFVILFALFIAWAIGPRQTRADFSRVKWNIELDRKMDIRDDNLYQQAMSLVDENTGTEALQEIPVDLTAKIEPPKPADIMASFLGRRLMIMQRGHSLPLTILLSGPIQPAEKKRYFLEGSVQATPPFKVTYEVREEGRTPILASYMVEE